MCHGCAEQLDIMLGWCAYMRVRIQKTQTLLFLTLEFYLFEAMCEHTDVHFLFSFSLSIHHEKLEDEEGG